MKETILWLLQSEAYVAYRARLDLLDQSANDPEVVQARKAMLSHPLVQSLLADLGDWPGKAINNHKKADLPIHKLAFLAELGLTAEDPGIESVARKITAHLSKQGIPEVPVNIPKAFGGTGEDMWAWMLCDTPRLLFALKKLGVNDARLDEGMSALAALAAENGWPCAGSPKIGRFRGPGKKGDPCPYANLLMMSALLESGNPNHSGLRAGAECLLYLWEHSRDEHPFLFYMGTDFRKLKAPFIWYDILHVADVLSQLDWLRGDPRSGDILSVIRSKAGEDGRFTAESVWTAWKAWDFGQKKQPSPWLTFAVLRIFKRLGETISVETR